MSVSERLIAPTALLLSAAFALSSPWGLGADEGTTAPPVDRGAALLLKPTVIPEARPGATGDSAAPYSSALTASLARALREAGFVVQLGQDGFSPRSGENEEAAAMAGSIGCGWAVYSVLFLNGYRLSYRISVYEATTGALAAADTFSAIAGLGVLALFDESSARVAAKTKTALQGLAEPRRVVGYRVRVSSPDEGAAVSLSSTLGSEEFPLGNIEGGSLELPYFPFLVGETVDLTVSAPQRRAQETKVKLGDEPPTVSFAALPLSARSAFYVDTGSGRLLGAGGGYRRYIKPDWWYFFAEDRLFAGSDFLPGSSPLVHDELWVGLGWYLLSGPQKRFRFGAQLGAGALASLATGSGSMTRTFLDVGIRPVDLFAEWSLNSRHSIRLGLSSAYSLGTGSLGLLGRRWMGDGPPDLSLGWDWKR